MSRPDLVDKESAGRDKYDDILDEVLGKILLDEEPKQPPLESMTLSTVYESDCVPSQKEETRWIGSLSDPSFGGSTIRSSDYSLLSTSVSMMDLCYEDDEDDGFRFVQQFIDLHCGWVDNLNPEDWNPLYKPLEKRHTAAMAKKPSLLKSTKRASIPFPLSLNQKSTNNKNKSEKKKINDKKQKVHDKYTAPLQVENEEALSKFTTSGGTVLSPTSLRKELRDRSFKDREHKLKARKKKLAREARRRQHSPRAPPEEIVLESGAQEPKRSSKRSEEHSHHKKAQERGRSFHRREQRDPINEAWDQVVERDQP